MTTYISYGTILLSVGIFTIFLMLMTYIFWKLNIEEVKNGIQNKTSKKSS